MMGMRDGSDLKASASALSADVSGAPGQGVSWRARLDALGERRAAWWTLAIAALVLRIGFVLVLPHVGGFNRNGQELIASGSDGYEKIARHLLQGDGYRIKGDRPETMLRNPLYVMVIAGWFQVFGDHKLGGQVLQAITSAIIILLIRPVGRKAVGPGASFLAGVAYALYPADWIATFKYVVEPLLALLLLVFLLVLPRFVAMRHVGWAILAGLIGGLMVLAKSVAIYWLPFMLVWTLLFMPAIRREFKRFLLHGAIAGAVCFLTVLPWGVYNHHRSGHWVFSSTVTGFALHDVDYINQHRGTKSRLKLWLEAREKARQFVQKAGITPDPKDEWCFTFFSLEDEYRAGELLKKETVRSMLAAPVRSITGVFYGIAEYWYIAREEKSTLAALVMHVPPLILVVFALLWRRLYREPHVVWWLGAIVYMNLICAVASAIARYALPVMPLVFLLAAAAVVGRPRGVDPEASPQ